jgi:hypothetical protein
MNEQMIESFIEGRVRLRSPLFTDERFAERARAGLMKIGGVLRVEANPRTGGLLLEYDKKRLPMSVITRAAGIFPRINDLAGLPPDERDSAFDAIAVELERVLGG